MGRTLALAAAILLFAGAVWFSAGGNPPAQGYSGLIFSPMTPSAAARAPLLANGALILSVEPDSPAARAKIQPGEVVAAIDGIAVTSARQVSERIGTYRAGQTARLTLYDVTDGDVHPDTVALVLDALPDPEKTGRYSVKPPRVLAKEFSFPPPMAANAAWSKRLARGATTRPLELFGLGAGPCNGFAPEHWVVAGAAKDGSLFHVMAGQGFAHAIYQSVALNGRSPLAVLGAVLQTTFNAPAVLTPAGPQPFGFQMLNFGNDKGGSGFVAYRVNGAILQMWIAAVPGAEVAWSLPLTGAVVFSLNCSAGTKPRAQSMEATSISLQCSNGNKCQDSDFASAYLNTLKLGYVHDMTGKTYLVQPKRDYWFNGAQGPGFYHQTGGENEKLEPGRTN